MHASTYWDSGMYPCVGELWDMAGNMVVICGNGFHSEKDTKIWVMDWNTGTSLNALPEELTERPDRKRCPNNDLMEKFIGWSRAGNADAMWWLAYWYEGINHQRSVWYYVAAMRADRTKYGWAQARVYADARFAGMCEGYAKPDITFLTEIPEMLDRPISSDWQPAVAKAEQVEDIPTLIDVQPGYLLNLGALAGMHGRRFFSLAGAFRALNPGVRISLATANDEYLKSYVMPMLVKSGAAVEVVGPHKSPGWKLTETGWAVGLRWWNVQKPASDITK